MATVLDDFITQFSFETDDAGLKRAQQGIKNVQDKINKAAKGFFIAGGALTGALLGVGKTVFDFDTQVNALQAATNASAEDMKKMRDQAIELGRSTQFSASQAAEAQKLLGQAGLSTTQILETMPNVLSLAAAGGLEMGEAAAIMTSQLAAFNLDASQAGRVADVLAAAAASAKTDVSQMGVAFRQVAPLASELGLSIEETSAMLAQLQNKGLKAEMAGTGVRNVMLRLLKPTSESTEAIENLGISYDMIADMVAQGKVAEAMELLGDKGMDVATATTVFGAEAANAAVILAGSTQEVNKLTEAYKNAAGASDRMAKQQMQGMVGAVLRLKSAFEGMLIALGDAGVTAALISMADFLSGLIARFQALSPGVKAFIASVITMGPILIGIGLALKGVAIALGGLSILVPVLGAAFGSLTLLMGPLGIILAIVAGAAYLLYRNWGKLSAGMKDIKATVDTFWDESVWPKIAASWEWLKGSLTSIETIVDTFWDESVWPKIAAAWEWLKGSLTSIGATVETFWDKSVWPKIGGIWENLKDSVLPIDTRVDTEWDPFLWQNIAVDWEETQGTLSQQIWARIGTFWDESIWPKIAAVWEWLKNSLVEIWTSIQTAWSETLWPTIAAAWEWLSEAIPAIWATVSTLWGEDLWPTISAAWKWLKNTLSQIWASVGTIWNKRLWPAIGKAWNFLREKVKEIAATIATLWDRSLWSTIREVWDALKATIKNIVAKVKTIWNKGLWPSIKAAWTSLKELYQNISAKVKTVWDENLWPSIKAAWTSLKELYQNISATIATLWDKALWPTIEAAWNSLKEFYQDISAEIKTVWDKTKWENIASTWDSLKQKLSEGFKESSEKVMQFWTPFVEQFSKIDLNRVTNAFKGLWELLQNLGFAIRDLFKSDETESGMGKFMKWLREVTGFMAGGAIWLVIEFFSRLAGKITTVANGITFLLNKFGEFRKINMEEKFHEIARWFENLTKPIALFVDMIAKFFNKLNELGSLKLSDIVLGEGLSKKLGEFKTDSKEFVGNIAEKLGVGSLFGNDEETAEPSLGKKVTEITAQVGAAAGQVPMFTTAPMVPNPIIGPSGASTNVSNRSFKIDNSTEINMNVNGGDPAEIREQVRDVIFQQNKALVENNDSILRG